MANVMRIGGGGGKPNELTVAVDTGAIVTATNGDKTVVGTSVDGNAVLKLPKAGIWSLCAELDGQITEDVIEIIDDYLVEVAFGLKLSSLAVGTLVRMKENGADVSYRVIHQGLPSSLYDASCDGTWVQRVDAYNTQNFNSSRASNYSTSTINQYLNNDFLALFNSTTQTIIKEVKIPYVNGNINSAEVRSGGNGLSTKVFLLSGMEVGFGGKAYVPEDGAKLDYFNANTGADSIRVAKLNGGAMRWWLRSPSGATGGAWVVNTDGSPTDYYADNVQGIRPAMVLDGIVNPEPNADGSYTLL